MSVCVCASAIHPRPGFVVVVVVVCGTFLNPEIAKREREREILAGGARPSRTNSLSFKNKNDDDESEESREEETQGDDSQCGEFQPNF